MIIPPLFNNPMLTAGLLAWSAAQLLKVPVEYFTTKKWNWSLLFESGGMPSSHSALMTSTSLCIGLFEGFNTGLFAIAVAISMIVIYDATGIRRQAGKHAELINKIINDLTTGHPLKQEQLREVLGHTPIEAVGGVLLGLVIAMLAYLYWA